MGNLLLIKAYGFCPWLAEEFQLLLSTIHLPKLLPYDLDYTILKPERTVFNFMLHVILQIFETKATTYSSCHLIFFRVDMPSSHIYFSKWYFQNALTVLNGFSFGFILKTHQPELNGILKTDLWRRSESQFLFWDTVLSINSQLDYNCFLFFVFCN